MSGQAGRGSGEWLDHLMGSGEAIVDAMAISTDHGMIVGNIRFLTASPS